MPGRNKWTDDPMVVIRGDRIEQARRARKLTIGQLAKEVTKYLDTAKDQSEAVRLIVREKTKRCRRSRRDALAAALDVRAEWLSGVRGAELIYDDRAGNEGEWHLDARHLMQDDVVQACLKALRRDVRHFYGEDDRAAAVLEASERWLISRILSLLHPDTWRWELLGWEGKWLPECSFSEEAVAVDGLGRALKIVLGPWLDGETPLNYGALRRLAARDELWAGPIFGEFPVTRKIRPEHLSR